MIDFLYNPPEEVMGAAIEKVKAGQHSDLIPDQVAKEIRDSLEKAKELRKTSPYPKAVLHTTIYSNTQRNFHNAEVSYIIWVEEYDKGQLKRQHHADFVFILKPRIFKWKLDHVKKVVEWKPLWIREGD
ncbi:MAG TPA: hypothetical protein VFK44_01760 [Bacillales bacterium]|nr:hypothetical protein [Bacillales bacterium]